jgi:hypothetical protein
MTVTVNVTVTVTVKAIVKAIVRAKRVHWLVAMTNCTSNEVSRWYRSEWYHGFGDIQ